MSLNCKTITSALLAALGAFLIGLDIGYIAPILECDSFKRDVAHLKDPRSEKIPDATTGFVVSIFSLGCILTSFPTVSGHFMEEWGRRDTIILGASGFLVGCSLQAGAVSIRTMLIGRLISGIAIGLLSPGVALYQSEVAPASARGSLSSLYQLMITLGILVASVVDAGLVHHDEGWRWAISFQLLPGVILVAGMPFLPRSPRWLVNKGRIEEAREVMQGMRATEEEATSELNEILEAAEEERTILEEDVAKKAKVDATGFAGLDSYTSRLLLVGLAVQILGQLVGMNAFVYFGPRMFGDMGLDQNKFQVLMNILNFLMTLPAVFFSDTCGRRFLLWTGAATLLVACVGMGSLGTLVFKPGEEGQEHVQYCMVSLVFLFVAAYAATWGPIPWVYTAEIFPQKNRAWCMGLTTTANWSGNWAIAQFTPVMLGQLGFATFFVFGLFSVAALILALWLPETKGVALENMQSIFKEKLGLGGSRTPLGSCAESSYGSAGIPADRIGAPPQSHRA